MLVSIKLNSLVDYVLNGDFIALKLGDRFLNQVCFWSGLLRRFVVVVGAPLVKGRGHVVIFR